jgi:hypothetical protein
VGQELVEWERPKKLSRYRLASCHLLMHHCSLMAAHCQGSTDTSLSYTVLVALDMNRFPYASKVVFVVFVQVHPDSPRPFGCGVRELGMI